MSLERILVCSGEAVERMSSELNHLMRSLNKMCYSASEFVKVQQRSASLTEVQKKQLRHVTTIADAWYTYLAKLRIDEKNTFDEWLEVELIRLSTQGNGENGFSVALSPNARLESSNAAVARSSASVDSPDTSPTPTPTPPIKMTTSNWFDDDMVSDTVTGDANVNDSAAIDTQNASKSSYSNDSLGDVGRINSKSNNNCPTTENVTGPMSPASLDGFLTAAPSSSSVPVNKSVIRSFSVAKTVDSMVPPTFGRGARIPKPRKAIDPGPGPSSAKLVQNCHQSPKSKQTMVNGDTDDLDVNDGISESELVIIGSNDSVRTKVLQFEAQRSGGIQQFAVDSASIPTRLSNTCETENGESDDLEPVPHLLSQSAECDNLLLLTSQRNTDPVSRSSLSFVSQNPNCLLDEPITSDFSPSTTNNNNQFVAVISCSNSSLGQMLSVCNSENCLLELLQRSDQKVNNVQRPDLCLPISRNHLQRSREVFDTDVGHSVIETSSDSCDSFHTANIFSNAATPVPRESSSVITTAPNILTSFAKTLDLCLEVNEVLNNDMPESNSLSYAAFVEGHFSPQPLVENTSALPIANDSDVMPEFHTVPRSLSVASSRSTVEPLTDRINVKRLNFRNSCILCRVSWIESPSKFWLQRSEAKDTVTEIVDTLRRLQLTPLNSPPLRRQYVAAPFKDEDNLLYYRAKVLDVVPCGSELLAHVIYIDYGNTAWLSANALRHLPIECAQHRWQAFLAKLIHVIPTQRNTSEIPVWSKDSVVAMEDLLIGLNTNGQLRATVTDFDSTNYVHGVTLHCVNGENQVTDIAQKLSELNFCVYKNSADAEYAVEESDAFVIPSWDELDDWKKELPPAGRTTEQHSLNVYMPNDLSLI